MIVFGSARHDENNSYINGKSGDQTGTEVSTQQGYIHKLGWTILRAKSDKVASKLSKNMLAACNNQNIGYDQGNRLDIIKKGINTKEKCECDCSSLVRECIIEAGIDIGNFTTLNAVSTILNTGKFEKVTFTTLDKVCTGDILCTSSKGHIVICTTGASRSKKASSTNNPYVKPTTNITSITNAVKHNIKSYVFSGDSVKYVQFELKNRGYNIGTSGIDGNCGGYTVSAIMQFQKDNGLTVDGVAGSKTLAKM